MTGCELSDATLRNICRAAQLIARADALLVTAGAGMSVDSGLPDFRSENGLWGQYPGLGLLGLSFKNIARPQWFEDRPEMAWAFYGHRQRLYRDAVPHGGFAIIRDWVGAMPGGYFVVTSNVDGQFTRAGIDPERLLEVHGSLHRLQCTRPCGEHTWAFGCDELEIDLSTCTARGALPICPNCGAIARPNAMLFDDLTFVAKEKREQQTRYQTWLASVRRRRLVILEVGAGVSVPTIRRIGEHLAAECERATLIRLNPQAGEADEPVIPVALCAFDGLTRIAAALPATTGVDAQGTSAPEADRTKSDEPQALARSTRGRVMHEYRARLLQILRPRAGDVSRDGYQVRKLLAADEHRRLVRNALVAGPLAALCLITVITLSTGAGSASLVGGVILGLISATVGCWFIWRARFPFEWVLTDAGVENVRRGFPRETPRRAPPTGLPTRPAVTQDNDVSGTIGRILGGLAGVAAFIGVYLAAVDSVGWVIGIALGWIPAGLAGALAYLTLRYLWWLAILGGLFLVAYTQ